MDAANDHEDSTIVINSKKRMRLNLTGHSCKSQRTCWDKYFTPDDFLRSFFPEDKKRTRGPIVFKSHKVYDTHGYDMETVSAIRRNDIEKLRYMYKNDGKNMNACNRNGETLLHLACRSCNIETVKFLVEEANVNVDSAVDGMGRTVLHDLLWRPTPNFEMLSYLLKSTNMSAELLLAEDVRGHTPFGYSRKEHSDQWLAFLRENQARIEQRMARYDALPEIRNDVCLG